jgi:hypothetical protein
LVTIFHSRPHSLLANTRFPVVMVP